MQLIHEQYQNWQTSLPLKGVFIATDGTLTVQDQATDDDLLETAQVLNHQRDAFTKLGWLADKWTGELILAHSAKHGCTWKESIESLKLCESDGRSMRSLSRLPRIVSRLPSDVLGLPLTTKHFDAVTEVMQPEGDGGKWMDGIRGILIDAASKPDTSSREVSQKVRALQLECGMKLPEKHSALVLAKGIIEAAYLLYTGSERADKKKVSDYLYSAFTEAFDRGVAVDPDAPEWECPKHLRKGEFSV